MIRIENAQTKAQLDDLNLCMLKCKSCNCVGSLQRFIKRPDGTFNKFKLKQESFTGSFVMNVEPRGNITYIYLDIMLKKKSDIQSLQNLWETARRRGTQKFFEGEANDYKLVIDLLKGELENERIYCLSFAQPIFISDEGAGNRQNIYMYRMVFDSKDVFFGIEKVTQDEMEYEIASDRSGDYDDADNSGATYEDSDIADVNEKFISNDKVTNISENNN